MVPDISITVRNIEFPLPETGEFSPIWIENNPTLSYFTLGLSLYNPYIEPFLVQTMRTAATTVTDAVLLDEIDRFCRQEAKHYQQHEKFNNLIRNRHYPGLEVIEGRCKRQLQGWLSSRSLNFCVGIATGFELYTSQGAVMLLDSGLLEGKNVEPRFSQLFQWHLIEELEHRSVALDVWDQLKFSYLERVYLNRIGQQHMLRFAVDCMRLMSRIDTQRFGRDFELDETIARKLLVGMHYTFLKTYVPFYSPRRLNLTPKMRKMISRFNEMAGI